MPAGVAPTAPTPQSRPGAHEAKILGVEIGGVEFLVLETAHLSDTRNAEQLRQHSVRSKFIGALDLDRGTDSHSYEPTSRR